MDFDRDLGLANRTTTADDTSFGPQLYSNFDFTLLFEHAILTILPSCLLLLLSFAYVVHLWRKPASISAGLLLWFKMVAAGLLFGSELAGVILWSQSDERFRTAMSLAASSISCVTMLCIAVVLYLEHHRSLRSSTFLSIYLSMTVLFDIAKARSYFRRAGLQGIAVTAILSAVLKFVLLLLEETSKRSLIHPKPKSISLEAVSGFWTRSLFLWINSTLLVGFRNIIDTEHMPDLGPEFDSNRLFARFDDTWKSADKSSRHALPHACFKALIRPFCAIILPRLCFSGFKFAQPFLLQAVVRAIGQGSLTQDVIGGLIGATVLVYFGLAVTKAYQTHLAYRCVTMLRGQLVSAIFKKTLRLNLAEAKKSAAVTLMSSDISSIEGSFTVLYDIWAGILELGVGVYLLARLVGQACFLVIIPAIVSTMVSLQLAKLTAPARTKWQKSIQTRVAASSEVLNQMKGIKMTGLTASTSHYLSGLRHTELENSGRLRRINVVLHALATFSSSVTPVVIIAGGLFWTKFSGKLNAADVFTTLSITVLVTSPLTTLLIAAPQYTGMMACFERIQTFLLLSEKEDARRQIRSRSSSFKCSDKSDDKTHSPDVELRKWQPKVSDRLHPDIPVVELSDASIAPMVSGTEVQPILHNVSVKILPSTLTIVLGPVGSGKTTFLKSLLGEARLVSGDVSVMRGGVSYCDQTPWIRNLTIRENIVSGNEYNAEWYRTVLESCHLNEDLKSINGGEQALAGSNGVALSGGQKQRIALARAVYARKSLIVLDDVFSALDRRTSAAIFERLFAADGLLRKAGSTVIIATHLLTQISSADKILTVDENGSISEMTVPAGTIASPNLVEELRRIKVADPDDNAASENASEEASDRPVTKDEKSKKADDKSLERQRGDLSLYHFYFKSTGIGLYVLWMFSVALACLWFQFPYIFVRIWIDRDPENKTYFAGYATIAVTSCLSTAAMLALYMLKVVPTSAFNLHGMLLEKVMSATLGFLTSTDSGSLLNRFSQDMSLVNQVLPMMMFRFTYLVFDSLVDVAIIASGASYVGIIIPFLFIALYFLQKYYLRTSRQIRHLDLEAKSPLYTQFTEVSAGLEHVRAFGWQAAVMNHSLKLLDHSQKPYYLMFCIQRWLMLVLDLFVLAIAVFLVSLALNLRDTTTQSAIGLSLTTILSFSNGMSQLIDSWISLETSFGAIARLRTFLADTPTEQTPKSKVPSESWPQHGKLELNDVSSKYNTENDDSPTVLNSISLTVEAGQKVGIIGRTGSGKSSLLLTILRLLDSTGSISIDGVDISNVPHEELRSRITTIPQDCIEFSRSVRENLNPYDLLGKECEGRKDVKSSQYDNAMTKALSRVGLLEYVSSHGGLDADMSDLGLSHGQKQLLGLARAVLHNELTGSRLVLIDEATSNVDRETDQRMRTIISDAFSGCTILTIAHRLETVQDVDLIVELDAGRLIRQELRT